MTKQPKNKKGVKKLFVVFVSLGPRVSLGPNFQDFKI
jgi:hypothetical protein